MINKPVQEAVQAVSPFHQVGLEDCNCKADPGSWQMSLCQAELTTGIGRKAVILTDIHQNIGVVHRLAAALNI